MTIQWVIKASKFCNLRCRYCYEFPDLAKRDRIELETLEGFFKAISDHTSFRRHEHDFVWHGGEPTLLGRGYFDAAFDLQSRWLDSAGVKFTNSIQTNLFSLTEKNVDLLRLFSNVGVSVDLFGDLRVNMGGRGAQDTILRNMQRLFDQRVRFGCISVLSRKNFNNVTAIHAFFSRLGLSYRLLPIYRTGFSGQQEDLALEPHEIVQAYIEAFEAWRNDPVEIEVKPVDDFVTAVVRSMLGPPCQKNYYIKKPEESLFIVDTDGGVYANADAYDTSLCYGNIKRHSIRELLATDNYHRAYRERVSRSQALCRDCSWHGSCSGFYVAEATPEQRFKSLRGAPACSVVAPVLDHISAALRLDFSLFEAVKSRAGFESDPLLAQSIAEYG